MAREWHEFTFDLDEGELVLNCECHVSREYDYDDKREYVSVEIIRAPIGKLTLTRDMLCDMYGSEGVARHEEGKALVLTEDANDFWNSPEPNGVALYLEGRA